MSRNLYSPQELKPFLTPRAVAVVGASPRDDALGGKLLRNATRARGVQLVAVNPRYAGDEVHGVPCIGSLAHSPFPLDLVCVCIPRDGVLDALSEARAVGVSHAVVHSSGFGETGTADGIEAERGLARLVADGMRILGPNCLGAINSSTGMELHFTRAFGGDLVEGHVGIVSQSGGLGYLLGQAAYEGVGFSHWAATGNAVDVDVLDLAHLMLADPATRCVVMILEGLKNPERLWQLGRAAAAVRKPVLVHKLGGSPKGQQVAQSHTGALMGGDTLLREACAQAGLVVVDHFDELVPTASLFVKAEPRALGQVAVLSGSGGAAILAADEAHAAQVELGELQDSTLRTLNLALPTFARAGNPVDMGAEAPTQIFTECLDALATDPGTGLVLTAVTLAAETTSEPRAHAMAEYAATHLGDDTAGIGVVWLSDWTEGPGLRLLKDAPHVSVFKSFRSAFASARHWLDWRAHLQRSLTHGFPTRLLDGAQEQAIRAAGLGSLPAVDGPYYLNEAEGKRVLSALGIPIPPSVVVSTETPGALRMGDLERDSLRLHGITFPVVAKILDRHLLHKARVGAVRLNLTDPSKLGDAISELSVLASSLGSGSEVLVESMVSAEREWFVGASRNAEFGTVLTVGRGGTRVEELEPLIVFGADSAHELAALLAERFPAQQDEPGATQALHALAEAAMRLVTLLAALPEIVEVEVNPLLETAEGRLVAADAVITTNPMVAPVKHS